MRANRNPAYGMLFATAALALAFAPFPAAAQPSPVVRTFRVEAGKFAYLPAELNVNPGDTVVIQLVSTDVVHGLYIDGYDLSVQADPGQTKILSFTASKGGSFRFRCNVTCGAMHPFMIGKCNVGPDMGLVRAAALSMLGLLGLAIFGKTRA